MMLRVGRLEQFYDLVQVRRGRPKATFFGSHKCGFKVMPNATSAKLIWVTSMGNEC